MSPAEFRKLVQSYVPAAIEALKKLASDGRTESIRKSARKTLAARGIPID